MSTPPPHQLDVRAFASLKRRARLVLLWQALWPRLVWVLGAIMLVLALVLSGLLLPLPVWLRLGIVALGIAAIIAAFIHAGRVKLPDDEAALSFLDAKTQSRLAPARSLHDALVNEGDVASPLWAAHKARLVRAASHLKTGLPQPDMAAKDQYSLRYLLALVLLPVLVSAYGHYGARLKAAFSLQPPTPAAFRFDAFLSPPAYTGLAPIILPRAATSAFSAPAGSVLTLRYSGSDPMGLEATGALTAQESADAAHLFRLDGDGAVKLRLPDGQEQFEFKAIADKPPLIVLDPAITADAKGELLFSYSVSDDYGVKDIEAKFRLKTRDAPRLLVSPPDFTVGMPQARLKTGSHNGRQNLIMHPWAGLDVEMRLLARDDAGQEATSDWVTATLPERTFTHPLAKVFIDQRRDLALDAGAKSRLGRVFEALMTAPGLFAMPKGDYLLLSILDQRLKNAAGIGALRDYLDDLYAYAVALDEGDASKLEREVRAAAEALKQAIERGASPEEVKRLSDNLREAMRRLNQEMAEQARRNGQQQQARKAPPGAKVLRESDVQKLLDRIEELNRQGAKEQAQRLMDELQQMLRDMEEARRNGQMVTEDEANGRDGMRELSDMIRRQQQLRDETFKKQQQERQKNRRGQSSPQQPQAGDEALSDEELAQRQQDLSDQLGNLSDDLGQEGEEGEGEQQRQQGQRGQQGQGQQQGKGQGQSLEDEARQGFGQARRAMRDARNALGRGDRQGAMDAQNRAIRGLQQGQQALGEQQRQNAEGRGQGQGNQSRNAQGNNGTDPIGRERRERGFNDGDQTEVPGRESAMQRAQRLIEELRRRSGEASRPQLELDYIDRLLRGLGPN